MLYINEMSFFGTSPKSCSHLALRPFNITTEFQTGINFLVGNLQDFGGSFAYALCKGKHCSFKEICFNGEKISPQELQKLTYYIANEDTYFHGHYYGKSVFKHLKHACKKRSMDLNEIISKFELEDKPEQSNPPRVHRKISALSHNKYLYSSAIGFACGKKILCFPWFSCSELKSQIYRFSLLSRIALNENLILIIPVESTDLFRGEFEFNEIYAKGLNVVYGDNSSCSVELNGY